ncbi:MAG: DUF2141 domain-containing protein [Chlorobium phaeobacteroides]|uniref:DUF2141 domain-containing protein n=1 Tax=Chlorobium phaeobacteroides (strain BS1) TaxID=331678 RepID=B3EJM6_CHLPB|nr:DUF2141 domain-containing protein [Chlorobium phaeobacteroides]
MRYLFALCISLTFFSASSFLYGEENTEASGTEVIDMQFNDSQDSTTGEKGSISIQIENIKNTNGRIAIALYNSEEGFPEKPEIAYALAHTSINGTSRTVVIENIPYGTYALSILHDENENNTMDKTWIGKPKEGFGSSNNPKIRFRAPKFEEADFLLDSEKKSIAISMKYL